MRWSIKGKNEEKRNQVMTEWKVEGKYAKKGKLKDDGQTKMKRKRWKEANWETMIWSVIEKGEKKKDQVLAEWKVEGKEER